MPVRTRVAATTSTMVMAKSDIQFQIEQLRMDKVIYDLHSIAMCFLAVLTAVFLPQILFQFVYLSNPTPSATNVLTWIPVISYVVAAAVTVLSFLGNIMRWKKIKALERELWNA
ncbi:MAG TPA: hypothetical protein VFG51_00615 [Candidatus Saccharimonadia bacterium]|nr:hypothetical protein [Candidatus Saccharimonadia bacterium]